MAVAGTLTIVAAAARAAADGDVAVQKQVTATSLCRSK